MTIHQFLDVLVETGHRFETRPVPGIIGKKVNHDQTRRLIQGLKGMVIDSMLPEEMEQEVLGSQIWNACSASSPHLFVIATSLHSLPSK
jgi:hypothetical protein